jgi:hypothetical protein
MWDLARKNLDPGNGKHSQSATLYVTLIIGSSKAVYKMYLTKISTKFLILNTNPQYLYVGSCKKKFGSGKQKTFPVPRMYALFFHRLSIYERATDHKYIKGCSHLRKKRGQDQV